jgi:hypothetical protein
MISVAIAMALSPSADTKVTCGSDLTAATDWVSLVDTRHWDESWSSAGTLFQSRMPQPRWASTIQPVREPFGAVALRSLQSVTKATALPGVPDGHYQVVKFKTNFANKKGATETVVLACEGSGWTVDGYFIR